MAETSNRAGEKVQSYRSSALLLMLSSLRAIFQSYMML